MKKIIAKENMWLTQESLFKDETRTFNKAIYESDASPKKWIEVDDDWKSKWEEINSLNLERDNAQSSEYLEEYDSYKNDRDTIINKLLEFDKSENINSFVLNGVDTWFSKEVRLGLRLRINAEKDIGKTITTLWYEGTSIIGNIKEILNMLNEIEIYASKTFDRTQEHLSIIKTLKSYNEIYNYPYSLGYPKKLVFNIKNYKNILDIEN